MDIYDKGTLFCRLRQAIYDEAAGDRNATDRKIILIDTCIQKFGEQETKRAIEVAKDFLKVRK